MVTGPSGSGKSSLVFDTLYAEGQRRYVETFSAYARQFLDRMDKPAVDRVEGVPPAIAIDQTNPVRSSRSTVGTMTELNDHLKLLFARAGQLFDRKTALPVRHDTPETIYAELMARTAAGDPRLVVTFPVELPGGTSPEEVEQWLSASGFTRVQAEREVATPTGPRKVLDVVADRFRLHTTEKARAVEAIEVALKRGAGRLTVYSQLASDDNSGSDSNYEPWKFSTGLHCPESDLRYSDPIPSMFSFNSAVGACETCRGFGRVIGVDYGLVIPNDKLTLRAGAIKTIQTPAWSECQDDLMRHAETAGIPRDTPWYKLTPEQKQWVIDGTPSYKEGNWNKQWYGIRRFFEYLESKAYKMHIRVLLSKYRSYTPCDACGGARLKTESLLWRIGSKEDADAVLEPSKRFLPVGVQWTRDAAGGAAGPVPARPDAAADRPAAQVLRPGRADCRSACGAGRPAGAQAPVRGNHHPPEVPGGRGHRLPHAGPAEPHAFRRRSAADQPDHGARHLAGQHAVRARRAQHRAAPARHESHHRGHEAPARRGQHPGGGGARPGRHAGGRPHPRHGSRPRRARRPDRLRRHHRGPAPRRHAHRRLPGRAQARGHGLQARRDRCDAAPDPRRRARAQPAEPVGGIPAAAAGVRDGRVRLRQVQPDPGRAGAGADAPLRQGDRNARRARPAAGRRPSERRRLRRPVAHRQDRALQPGELRRRLGRGPRNLRRVAAGSPARLHVHQVQLQQRRRPLPHLRRLRLRARRDAVPLRRVPALPRLRRQALPPRNPRSHHRTQVGPQQIGVRFQFPQDERRRCARPHRERSRDAVRQRPRRDPRAAAHRRRGTRIREARPAGADALGRRVAAPQARGLPGTSRQERDVQPPGHRQARHAVHVRRADHRAALRRHRQADARIAQAAGRRQLADRDRAQPGRDPRRRLADRPGARRRRRRWPASSRKVRPKT